MTTMISWLKERGGFNHADGRKFRSLPSVQAPPARSLTDLSYGYLASLNCGPASNLKHEWWYSNPSTQVELKFS